MISSNYIEHKKEHTVLLWGFLVSFLGSLPPGTTNLLTAQLTAEHGYKVSTWFALGCMLSEILCVSLCLAVMDKISRSGRIMRTLEWVSLLVLIWIIISSFATLKGVTIARLQFSPIKASPFFFGFVLMAMNPVQLPFWAGWTTVLMQRGLLKDDRHENIQYVSGIALGSIVASMLFIAFGQALTHWVAGKERTIQWVFLGMFVVIAAIQVTKIVRSRVVGQ